MSTNAFDVAIVGGGPAGLSAATTLARSLRSVIVIDAGEPRNAPAEGAHNVLGNEGIRPTELLAKGRAEARGYGTEIRSGAVTDAARTDEVFTLELADGDTVTARRVLLAAGLVDELPDVPGVRELWGSTVLHCPYCHGYEVRGRRIGVLGTSPMSVHQTLLFSQLSDDVTLFTHTMPPIEDAELEQLSALGVSIVDGAVDHLDIADDALRAVALADGTTVERDALVVAPRFVVRSELYTRLGGTLSDHPMGGQFIAADPMGATDIPGLWAAGNVANLAATVSVSMGAGVTAGGAINMDLVAEDARRAVDARRAGATAAV
ncbi:NAD(P)/FAD-dependent oxidoreductase [Gordonia sp. PKS22-38]|uniref:NAD(P)/FAD-dependent oxidoreductase n=1 Tax=Gordonia prachuapensis TaxID=3115651 RepID=A0ABU7MP47_9ACTN|nr:NAD(P)/FAD-dependent oxidoreductase [Gordonia sp. PKS22-38]